MRQSVIDRFNVGMNPIQWNTFQYYRRELYELDILLTINYYLLLSFYLLHVIHNSILIDTTTLLNTNTNKLLYSYSYSLYSEKFNYIRLVDRAHRWIHPARYTLSNTLIPSIITFYLPVHSLLSLLSCLWCAIFSSSLIPSVFI